MVKLHTSLLALTLATGLVLASSDDYYQRRDDELFERDLNDEEYFSRQYNLLDERSDTFDELEERNLLSAVFKIGEGIAGKAIKSKAGSAALKIGKTAIKQGHHEGSARKPSRIMAKRVMRVAKQANSNNNNGDQNKAKIANQGRAILQSVQTIVGTISRFVPNSRNHLRGRGLEDGEELSQRDDEEVFGREYYDILDERDIFDDLD